MKRIIFFITVLTLSIFIVLTPACTKAEPEDVEEVVEELVEESPPETIEEAEEETPPVVEEKALGPIEWEGVIIPAIEGLRFEEGIFFAGASNPYGLEAGEKAGVFVKDAVEINGVMGSFIGLRPEVIKVVQKKKVEENEEFGYPFFIDLESARGIKINEVANTDIDKALKDNGFFWDNNKDLVIIDIPVGTRIYSPFETPHFIIYDRDPEQEYNFASRYLVYLTITQSEFDKGDLIFKNENFNYAYLVMASRGWRLLPYGIEKNITKDKIGNSESYFFSTEVALGDPIAEVLENRLSSGFYVNQLKDKNKDVYQSSVESQDISKILKVGSVGFLKVEEIPVFISPADD
jgi:hypothetical protein